MVNVLKATKIMCGELKMCLFRFKQIVAGCFFFAFPVLSMAQGSLIHNSSAQVSEDRLDFDVATVKPSGPGDEQMAFKFTDDGLEIDAAPLSVLLQVAFSVEADQLLALPGWGATKDFDVRAKVEDADVENWKTMSVDHKRLYLRQLLEQRFQLLWHKEDRTFSVLELQVANGGSKTLSTLADKSLLGKENESVPKITTGIGSVNAKHISISALATILSSQLEHKVVDLTGLTGTFSFVLQWTPDDAPPTSADLDNLKSRPGLMTALREQLGLTLKPKRTVVPAIVLDRVTLPLPN
jgi:uncharacterized protein (TIGR03435 family)